MKTELLLFFLSILQSANLYPNGQQTKSEQQQICF